MRRLPLSRGTLRTAFEQRSRPMAQTYEPASRPTESAYELEGKPWVLFAGIMILLVGVMNVIYGIAAIDKSTFFVQDAKYVFAELNTWGWVLLVVGVVQLIAAFGIWSRRAWGRWIGIISASGNAVVQLLFISSYPLASLALFAVDLLVIYGLVSWDYRDR
jgi:uncharacterized membrane protein HdeD (DUF308 family)